MQARKAIANQQECGRARKVRLALLCVFVAMFGVLLLAGLGGCKYTDVLTEHTLDEELGQLDERIDPIYKEVDDGQAEPIRTSRVDDSDRTDEQKRDQADYDENTESTDTTDNRKSSDDSAHNQQATEGDEEDEDDGENTEAGDGEAETDETSGTGEGTGTGTTSAAKTEAGNGPMGGPEATGGSGGNVTVYDPSAPYTPIDENIGAIAACGPLATIVQMLGAGTTLAATDNHWKEYATSHGMFQSDTYGENANNVEVAWTYDEVAGTYTLTDIDALMRGAKNSLADGQKLCIWTSGTDTKLDETEQSAIEAAAKTAGIDVVIYAGFAPVLGQSYTTDANIITAVQWAAQALQNSHSAVGSSQERCNAYVEYHTNAIEDCVNANGGYSFKGNLLQRIYQSNVSEGGTSTLREGNSPIYTCFVDDWTATTVSTITGSRSFRGEKYLNNQEVSISGGLGLSAKGYADEFMLLDYYLQCCGVINASYDRLYPVENKRYVISVDNIQARDVIYDAESKIQSLTGSGEIHMPMWIYKSDSDNFVTGEDSRYPIMLTRTVEYAEKVLASANNTYGAYNTGSPYEIWVLPSGIDGSWSYGTAESFLASVWSLTVYRGAADFEACNSYVSEFYDYFYRVSDYNAALENYQVSYEAECPRYDQ